MLMYSTLCTLHGYLIVLLILIAIIGDYLVQRVEFPLARVLFDNITHASIGGLSWLIVCLIVKNRHSLQTVFEIVVCTLMSSFIDVDHFIAARSFHLEDATNLPSRPALHCSTIPCALVLMLLLLGYILHLKWILKFALIIFTAFASHHTRDATRRGYWFYPFGSTHAISYATYVILTIAIPYFVCAIVYYMHMEQHLDDIVII